MSVNSYWIVLFQGKQKWEGEGDQLFIDKKSRRVQQIGEGEGRFWRRDDGREGGGFYRCDQI